MFKNILQSNKLFIGCITSFLALGNVQCMDDQDLHDSPPTKKRKVEEPTFPFLDLPLDTWPLVLTAPQESKKTLNLVCSKFHLFCEKNTLKLWRFDPDNYPSFQQEMNKEWVKTALASVYSLSFINPIDESALDVTMGEEGDEGDEFEDKYIEENVFLSKEDFEYINKRAINLKELRIYNIPSPSEYMSPLFAYAPTLISFSFDYDGCIFSGFRCNELESCTRFTSLKNMDINSAVFSTEEEGLNFFSPLTNLENLTLSNVPCDGQWGIDASMLFRSLTCLNKLNTLFVDFTQEPDFESLTNLSSLPSLTNLSVHFDDCLDIFHTTIAEKDLFDILDHLKNLKRLSIDNQTIDREEIDEEIDDSQLFCIDSSSPKFLENYPQLEEIKGNMIKDMRVEPAPFN